MIVAILPYFWRLFEQPVEFGCFDRAFNCNLHSPIRLSITPFLRFGNIQSQDFKEDGAGYMIFLLVSLISLLLIDVALHTVQPHNECFLSLPLFSSPISNLDHINF